MNEESRVVRSDFNLPPSLVKRNRYTKTVSYITNKGTLNKLSNGNIYVSDSDSSPTLLSALSKNSTHIKSKILFEDRNVTFNELVKVVLIPSRQEYKSRGLENDLWWNSSDYFQFQQEARSEITLCATYENITFSQARTKLYQPDPEESDPYNSKLTISQSISQMSLTQYDDEDYFSARDTISAQKTTNNDDNNAPILFYQNSPKPSMTNMIPESPNKSLMRTVKRVSYTTLVLDDNEDEDETNEDVAEEKYVEEVNHQVKNDISSEIVLNKRNINHDDLNVCVISPECQELTTSSSHPDEYLQRLRKRNMITLFSNLDTPSITVCSVFALTLVAVVARFF